MGPAPRLHVFGDQGSDLVGVLQDERLVVARQNVESDPYIYPNVSNQSSSHITRPNLT